MFSCELRIPTREEMTVWALKCEEQKHDPVDHIGYIEDRGPHQKSKQRPSMLVDPRGKWLSAMPQEEAPVTVIVALCPFCTYAHKVDLKTLEAHDVEAYLKYQEEHILDLDAREAAKAEAKKK